MANSGLTSDSHEPGLIHVGISVHWGTGLIIGDPLSENCKRASGKLGILNNLSSQKNNAFHVKALKIGTSQKNAWNDSKSSDFITSQSISSHFPSAKQPLHLKNYNILRMWVDWFLRFQLCFCIENIKPAQSSSIQTETELQFKSSKERRDEPSMKKWGEGRKKALLGQ